MAITLAATRTEFGDFQTPTVLADAVCSLLAACGIRARSIIEPTSGIGNILIAALHQFPAAESALAVEVNPGYVRSLTRRLKGKSHLNIRICQESFFNLDWTATVADMPEPILIVGNPPWVTNADLAILGSSNVPVKSNFQRHAGLAARTGKSNFDISEWMLIQLLDSLSGRNGAVAMLCKTAVARKLLEHAWKSKLQIEEAAIFRIDAMTHFGAAVDACLLLCKFIPKASSCECRVYPNLEQAGAWTSIGYRGGCVVADIEQYERWSHLYGEDSYRWRSGIKHDAAKVFELTPIGPRYKNGLGEMVDLEDTYLYPMLKSSEIANSALPRPVRRMLVTQRSVGKETSEIAELAPKTWRYLKRHAELLDRRASSIYRNRPSFSIFGVGPYTFEPWKVAISGLYKRLRFTVVAPLDGKPVVLDDTCNFLPCRTEQEAAYFASLLNSAPATECLGALVFWDAKRPITVGLLERLDLRAVSRELGSETTLDAFPSTQKVLRAARKQGEQYDLL